MAQLLRTLTLPEDPGPFPSSHMVGSQPSITPAQGNLMPSSDCQDIKHTTSAQTDMQTKHSYIIKKRNWSYNWKHVTDTMQFPSKSQ